MKRAELISVFKSTVSYGKRFGGRFDQSVSYDASEVPEWNEISAEPSKKGPGRGLPAVDPPEVTVVNADTLTTALKARADDPDANILILNLASERCAGGGVKKGSSAQEEQCYRCSDYEHCINRAMYPIASNSFIVTENVTVFKDENFNLLREPQAFDFIAMPAVRRPSLRNGTYMDKRDLENMKLRIDLIFRYAALENKDTLILGALGCGAFRNPVRQVAMMFKECIQQHGGYFKKIIFAVMSHSDDRNFKVFNAILTGEGVDDLSPEPEIDYDSE